MKPGIGHNNPPPDRFCPECGFVLEKRKKPRSTPQHRRLWGLLHVAFDYWPRAGAYGARDVDELRTYLLIKAKWCDSRIQVGKGPHYQPERSMTYTDGDVTYCYTPKSIAYANMTHHEACQVFSVVDEIIEATIGVPADKLLENAKRHAA